MSSESFKKLNGGNLDEIQAGKVVPTNLNQFVAKPVPVIGVPVIGHYASHPAKAGANGFIGGFTAKFSSGFKTNLVKRPTTDEDGLNKTERARYEHLKALKVECLGPQAITLKFGHDLRFTPDFSYLENGVMVFEDTKGFQRDDALVKIRACARMFSWARFLIVKKSKTVPMGWDITEVKP